MPDFVDFVDCVGCVETTFDAAARFEARVGFENGEPVVTWDPDLGPARAYTTQGAKTLGGGWDDLEDGADWDAAGYRFFRVKVELP